jgi:Arc/MetJ-type ribon-helix-helix transcriptional regulator
MARKVVAVSMPPGMAKWVQERVANDQEFVSVSDYIRELVRNDKERLRIKAATGTRFDSHYIPGATYTRRLR